MPFRFTHDLVYLLDLIANTDDIPEDWYDKASFLNSFAVEVRYPNERFEIEDSEVKLAIQYAGEFRGWLIGKINIDIADDFIIFKVFNQ